MSATWDEMAVVGRIARAHGIRGQVIVNPETDFPEERFLPGAELFVNRGGGVEPVTVTTVRFHRERPVIGLRGVERNTPNIWSSPCGMNTMRPVLASWNTR